MSIIADMIRKYPELMARICDEIAKELFSTPKEKPYDIGYCKPPLNKRFKPGQSGNPSGRPKDGNIPQKLRFEVFKRDLFTCQYCGETAPKVMLECDHIIPVTSGGATEMSNLTTSCRRCNRGKGNQRS